MGNGERRKIKRAGAGEEGNESARGIRRFPTEGASAEKRAAKRSLMNRQSFNSTLSGVKREGRRKKNYSILTVFSIREMEK